MGVAVTLRFAAGMLAVLLGGCAGEPTSAPMSRLGASEFGAVSAAQAAPQQPVRAEAIEPVRKTVAAKVLSAMAFEKVTGLKADPARLLEAE